MSPAVFLDKIYAAERRRELPSGFVRRTIFETIMKNDYFYNKFFVQNFYEILLLLAFMIIVIVVNNILVS